MSWVLKGLGGPLKGKTFAVKDGLTLGRQGAVVIPDLKASSIHARILKNAAGEWVLADNSSKNGTRVAGERITTISLAMGLQFYIGDQGFEIAEAAEEGTVADAAFSTGAVPGEAPAPSAPRTKRYWNELLARFVEQHQDAFEDRKRPVAVLAPALILEFVRGLQVNSRWVLGYGPRQIGRISLDLPIFEPGAPAVCFEISPSQEGTVFKTSHPELVRINGEQVDSHVLHVGDTIEINDTLIEVDFTE